MYRALTALALALMLASCHQLADWHNTPQDNFDALWTLVDEHYCFFDEKEVDWDACRQRYGKRIYAGMSSQMLFQVCSEMLDELKDGHVNLSSYANTSYYTKWWSDYPQNYDERLVEQHYLGFDCRRLGSVKYAILRENIGYISYPSFATGLGDGNIDAILSYFSVCTGLIIDIRDNGGGNMTSSDKLASHFVQERTLAGYMVSKSGPGHSDFAEPFAYYIEPASAPHLLWDKPVAVLTNRSTFSAANNFVSVMQYLPQVRIVGARTGGGSGMPISMELPCGWSVRMSSLSVLDAKGLTTEWGIEPSAGCEVALDPLQALDGRDTMIERAIEVLRQESTLWLQ